MTWQMQQARTNFDELLEASLHDRPQVVERDGQEMAVLVPMDEWKRMQGVLLGSTDVQNGARSRITLKDVLLHGSPGIDDIMIPERGQWLHREPSEF